MLFTAQDFATIATLTPRAQQVVGLIMWTDDAEREIVMARSEFYAKLHFHPTNANMMAIQRAVAQVQTELRAQLLPNFDIRVGDNDLGEDEMLFTISY
ncbi:hypothetical protein PQ472_11515 [Lacticaseibacillus pabuli]|uniref:Uncharacterized protein n=1 Tax=Lacticaseibacillus pabuli TaxID=3025672 RepID=A0ABY7WU35_9LACO|nr:hypothetical protein [Lacticaseibacillus sp. KACC 23028]WDF82506.1 hypothetical protein PQ472_11515 [Lacticaseibacillus sp. KACC 23028]